MGIAGPLLFLWINMEDSCRLLELREKITIPHSGPSCMKSSTFILTGFETLILDPYIASDLPMIKRWQQALLGRDGDCEPSGL